MRPDKRRAAWIAGTLLGLFAAGCGNSTRDTTAMPETPDGSQPPTAVTNDPRCPLQFAAAPVSMLTGTDPLLAKQWHLANNGTVAGQSGQDLRAVTAWQTTKGENVRVAVIDDGIEVTHEDLAPNVVTSASYNYRATNRGSAWPLPCEAEDNHGTAVAGIITARDFNGKGVAGVAPRAGLVGFNALKTENDADIADALGRDLDRNAIYNNSWGSPDNGQLHPVNQSFIEAIDRGIANGRQGKGAIYVFPGGNGGCYKEVVDSNGVERCIGENSNFDGYVNKLGMITVCSVDANGVQPFYGERGANLLVCAPSSNEERGVNGIIESYITTTALENKYRSDFTGTSASTPMVSGVVALMLAANPELTWRDVRLILASTARQNDFPARGAPAPDPEWTTQFGLHFSHKYGFGVANAQAAVQAARTWKSVGGSSSLLTCGPYSQTVNVAVPDPAGAGVSPVPVTSPINVPACAIGKIEFVEVRFTASHALSGELQIRLRSPRGLVSELADARPCTQATRSISCGVYSNYPFGSVRHMDEPVNFTGTSNWTLEVADTVPGTVGTFGSWSITFFGRAS